MTDKRKTKEELFGEIANLEMKLDYEKSQHDNAISVVRIVKVENDKLRTQIKELEKKLIIKDEYAELLIDKISSLRKLLDISVDELISSRGIHL